MMHQCSAAIGAHSAKWRARKAAGVLLGALLGAIGFFALCGQPARAQQPVVLQPVEVIATTPGEGATLDADKFPAFTTTVGADEFATVNSPNLTDTLVQRVPGAITQDTNGNAFSQEFYYRGFVASPVEGRPQGLAVYEDGVRINEAFGDTVNWDLVPPQAIYDAQVFTNNPIFGLNALGGAINLQMKNGFLWQGFEGQAMGGSWGRVSGMFQYGVKKDNWALYVTGDALHDDGWRYFSPSSLVRLFGDLGYKTPDAEIHLVAQGATTDLGIIGSTPVQLLGMDYRSVFTNPQTSRNTVGSIALNSKVDVSPTWTLQNNLYFRAFQQYHTDGNDANIDDCSTVGGPAGILCDTNNSQQLIDKSGNPLASAGPGFPYGEINNTAVHANTVGTTLQGTNRDKVFDHVNQFTVGASVDQSWLHYNATSTIGCIDPNLTVVDCAALPSSGTIFQDANGQDYVQTYLGGTTTYVGVYGLDTFNVTDALAVTGGARFNYAVISTSDLSGGLAPELNATNRYNRVNPVVGVTYKILPNLSAYAGYSEANRAPTPLETDCSNPTKPCQLASTLLSDPPLQQVVSHTIEAGLRGNVTPENLGTIEWKAGYFRTQNTNDIIQLASLVLGTGYFTNVPETLRQGVEAGFTYKQGPLQAYVNYSYVDATYQFTGLLSSPFNPMADPAGNILVTPGDHIPGIPRHQAKFGLDYEFTPKLKGGMDVIVVGSQYFVGDDSNQNPQLPAYWVANLHGSYQVTDNIQLFGLVNNLFNNHYATYGTYFDTTTDAQLATPRFFTGNPESITPAQPISLYGGIKVIF